MKNISIQKSRILQFIDYKGISKNKFYIETGISNGVLDKKSGLSMETVEKFYSTYPEINLEWLLTGKGSMLKNSNSSNTQSIVGNSNIITGNSSSVITENNSDKVEVRKLKAEIKELTKKIEEKDSKINKLIDMLYGK